MSTKSNAASETVLVVGATGHIGTAAVIGALRSGRNVLAAVRNQDSAKKLFSNVSEGHDQITIVEADVVSDDGVQGIVDQVKAGSLPPFQHVYACIGGPYPEEGLLDISVEEVRQFMRICFEGNFSAYRATVPYLLEQKDRDTSFTICTGAQGDMGARALPAMSQGALFSMANSAGRALAQTGVRFNEVYLKYRVEVDTEAEQHGVMKASEFARVYEHILARLDIKSCRVRVMDYNDLDELKVESRQFGNES